MTSTAANNNSTPATQPAQFSFSGTKSGSTLASLANATEPTHSSVNQQQTSVATFPQRPTEGSPTANTGSPFGVSLSQTPTQPFQFTKSSPSDASTFPFANQPTANVARFSFTNPQPANASNTSLNQSTTNVPQFSSTNSQGGNPSNFSFNQPTANVPRFSFTNPQPANASNTSLNQSTNNVARFSPTNSQVENPSNFSFTQPTANAPRFSSTNSQPGNPSNFSFNQPTANVPRFSFTNPQPANASNTSLNQSTTNVARFSPTNSQVENPSNFSFNQPTANVPRFSFTNPQPANASNTSLNQSTNNVARFSPTNSQVENPSNFSFTQPTANAPRFSSTNSQPGNPSTFSLDQPKANVSQFSSANPQAGNPSNPSFNQSTIDALVQQRLGSFTITPSTQKQEIANNQTQFAANFGSKQTPDEVTRSTASNASTYSKKLSDPPTPVSEQSSSFHQEQEESDTPATLAENSLVSKQINTTLRDSGAFVVDRSDPNSPLYSLTSFQQLNLKPDLLKGIYNMGFRTPSKIQEIALPHLLANPSRNIIAQSQSGTGKTAAFSLAIISRINPSIQSPQALIFAPTFELALQTGSVIERMAQFLPYIKIAYAVRDRAKSNIDNFPRGQLLPQPIVVGTPGTIEDWCRKKKIIDLKKLRICCLDEADVMIATQSFQETCVNLVRDLNPSNCQMMLFSATYSDDVMAFAREIIPNPAVLRLKREKQALNNIRQFFIECYTPEQKYIAIEQIFADLTVGQAVVFCRTKATARELAVRMANQNHSVRELTSALEIELRAFIIQQFRDGLFRVLITTDVTSRGIDIDDVSLVINYDMPVTTTFQPDCETYLHRIGRCGRFGKLGYTFNLIGSEKDLNTMKEIEEYFSHPIRKITIEEISQLEQDQE